jgi:type II secretory pathway component PulJ
MTLIHRNRKSGQEGFTLIEAVVATAVFAFVVSSTLAVYLATISLDSKSRAERAVTQNARFIMEFLSKEIRNGGVYYSMTNDSDTLSLLNQLDEAETIEWGGVSNPVITLNKPGLGTTNLNSEDVEVTRLQFILSPTTGPYNLANDSHIQPHVTVIMSLRSRNQKFKEAASIDIQSTYSTRVYPARF